MNHIIRPISYAGWKNCIQISNTVFEAILTTDVGPRIVRYAETGGPNMLWLNEYTAGQTEETKTWRSYGGHSFDLLIDGQPFLPPENSPVTYDLTQDSIIFHTIQYGIVSKDISVRMCRRGGLEIIHKITNTSDKVLNISINGNTLLRNGGTAALPISSDITELSGECCPCLTRGNQTSLFYNDMTTQNEYEIGIPSAAVWTGYFSQGNLFVMTSPAHEDCSRYNSIQFYSDSVKSRLSTFSKETSLDPGNSIELTEVWNIFSGVPKPNDEETAEKSLSGKRYFYDFVKMPVKGLDY